MEQAGTTIKLAEADHAALLAEELIEPDELAAATAALEAVKAGLTDRGIKESEARSHTELQDDLVRKLKVLRRKLSSAMRRAARGTAALKAYEKGTARGAGVADLMKDILAKLGAAAPLVGAKKGPKPSLIEAVKKAAADLEAANSAQEAAIKKLPADFRGFCEKKGKLYEAIKDLNDAGQGLYADDLLKAAQYNMKLLYRSEGKGKGKGKGVGKKEGEGEG